MSRARRPAGVAIAVSLLGLAALLLPGGALARPHRPSVRLYRVVYSGSGSYDVQLNDEGGVSDHEQAAFHWKAAYTPLVVLSRRGRVAMMTRRRGSSGGGEWSIASDNVEESCAKKGGLKLAPLGQGSGALGRDGSLSLQLTPGNDDFTTTGGSAGPGPCDTADFWQGWVTGFSHVGGGAESLDPLTAFVKLTAADLRAGRVFVNVSNVTLAAPELQVDPDCGSGDGATCKQSFEWKGRVTVTRLRSPRGKKGHRLRVG
jgi:hypothetical protein